MPPHPPPTPWLNFGLSTEMLTAPCSQREVSPRASWPKALGCPLVSKRRTAWDDGSLPSLARTRLARTGAARPRGGREGGKEGGCFFTRSQRVIDRVGTGRPGLLLPQRSTPLHPPGVSRPFKWGRVLSSVPAAEAEEPAAPRSGYSLPMTSRTPGKCPCTLVLDLSRLAGNTRDPDLLSTNPRQSPAGALAPGTFPKSLWRPQAQRRSWSVLTDTQRPGGEVLPCNVTALLGEGEHGLVAQLQDVCVCAHVCVQAHMHMCPLTCMHV